MSAYSSYQPTDLPWVRSIPQHWRMVRNGAVLTWKQKKVGKSFEQFDLLSLTTTGIRVKDINNVQGKVPASYESYQEVMPREMVFCLFDLDCSAVFAGNSHYHGMITSAYDVATPNESEISPAFLDYWFVSVFAGRHYKMYSKSVRYTINWDIFKAIKLPVPPRAEQDQIVRYLDWRVSKINSLIAAKKKQIAILKERKQQVIAYIVTHGITKDVNTRESGVDYIGQIPAHWKVLLNGRIYKENSRSFSGEPLVLSLSQKDGLIPYQDMTERSLHTSSYDNWKLVKPNDLVLNRFKAHLGVFFASTYEGIVTFHYGVYEPKIAINSKYYEALYHTNEYKNKYAGQSNGMTVGLQNLSNRNFYSVYSVYPPYEEQCLIVDRINEIEESTKALISEISAFIDGLHELRTRLISDVVTGQVDVRGVEVPDFEYVADEADEASDEDNADEDNSVDEEV